MGCIILAIVSIIFLVINITHVVRFHDVASLEYSILWGLATIILVVVAIVIFAKCDDSL